MEKLTDNQLIRLWHRIHERIRYGMGYQPWGWDEITLATVRPGLFRAYKQVQEEGRRRGL